ncbi:TIGR04282 family arsenosugar biosynthesis glycosyltransferase [Methyloligella sp. GL2]|nr:TIGR04282 family arsenosugar biosynthesis glycosyltransferase [Methyloligella sp. GL2]
MRSRAKRRQPVLIVMAKTPRLGAAKRRLAAEIGDVAALRFYRNCLNRMLQRLAHDPRWRVQLAVAPHEAIADPFWRRLASRHGVELVGQGEGDLGERMQRLLDKANGPAVLIGSDIPEIEPADIADAFRRLGRADAVFGPARDGGFWLAGFSRRQLHPFDDVRWSSSEALLDVIGNLKGRRIGLAATLSDVDGSTAYRRFMGPAARMVFPAPLRRRETQPRGDRTLVV